MQLIDEPELTPELIRSRYDALISRLRTAAERADRDPDGFRIVAVTKGFGASVVRAAAAAGLTAFGENRVQEAADKVAAAPRAEWHMIGRLQSNKVRAALRLFGTIHSVESVALLERAERIAHDDGHAPRVLLQVDMTGREGRAGFPADALEEAAVAGSSLIEALRGLRHAVPLGLMTIAPPEPGAARPCFARLRDLRQRLQQASGLSLSELSMGMTADAEEAIAEGATILRIGTALFGPRPERPHQH
jgi:pyridoxal phosphate enzyme (YggS family)